MNEYLIRVETLAWVTIRAEDEAAARRRLDALTTEELRSRARPYERHVDVQGAWPVD